MTKKRVIIQILILIVLGLIPLLWFKNDQLILGHDSGLPFSPLNHFIDRLYLWSTHFGFGIDLNNGLIGSVLVIHGLETLLTLFGFSLQNVEKIEFIFWFLLPGLTMYYAAYKMWPQKKYLPFIAAVIYMINYYLLQGWFAPERTKFSFYSGFPIFVYCMLSYFTKKMNLKKSVLLSGVTVSILNGGGSIPLYGGLLVTIAVISLYENIINFSKRTIFRTIYFLTSFTLIYCLLNAYWLIPYIKYLFTAFGGALAGQGGTEGTLNWTDYLSVGATFINLFRGQGIPDWYLNAYHAYAGNFLTNPLLIVVSFAYPLLAYAALLLVKKAKDKYYLYVIALSGIISLLFASGTKSQLSFIYKTFALYVPGFAIFRSSFYKFDYVLWLSYAILIGFTLDVIFSKMEEKIKNRNIKVYFSWLMMIGVLALIVLYHYPILNGSFFDYSKEPHKSLTTRVKAPQYVFDFENWVDHQDQNLRYLVLPELNTDNNYISYTWGYWSLATITSTLSRASFVQNDASTTGEQKLLIQQMYSAVLQNDTRTFNNLAQVLGINRVVLQKDYDWKNQTWGTTNPTDYEKMINYSNNFALIKKFGQWQVYDIKPQTKTSRISLSQKLGYMKGDLQNIIDFPYFEPQSAIYIEGTSPSNDSMFFNNATDIFISPECSNCTLENKTSQFIPYNPKILPGSILYPLITREENKVRKNAANFSSLFNYYLTFSDRRMAEVSWMIESQQKINYLTETLDRYIAFLSDLKHLAVGKSWDESSLEENEMAQSTIAHLLQESTMIESIYSNELVSLDNKIQLAKAYSIISDLITDSENRVWATKNTVDKKYSFDLSKGGEYQIYVKKNTLANPNEETDNAKVSFRDNPKKMNPIGETNGWLNFGSVTLINKKNYLNFTDPTVKNILDDIQPVLPDQASGIDISNGFYSLTAESQDKCISIPIKNLDASKGSEYSISFTYRNFTDNKSLAFYIKDPGVKYSKLRINDYMLPNNSNWTVHSILFNPKFSEASLNFCNGFLDLNEKYTSQLSQNISSASASDSASAIEAPDSVLVEIQGLAMYKVSTPTLVLYQKQKTTQYINQSISFRRKSPVEYEINTKQTKGPIVITLKESYAPYWQLCSTNNTCFSLTDGNHFSSVGFANAWYLSNGLSGRLDLYYTPQRLFIKSLIVTIVSIAILTIIACWSIIWKKRK